MPGISRHAARWVCVAAVGDHRTSHERARSCSPGRHGNSRILFLRSSGPLHEHRSGSQLNPPRARLCRTSELSRWQGQFVFRTSSRCQLWGRGAPSCGSSPNPDWRRLVPFALPTVLSRVPLRLWESDMFAKVLKVFGPQYQLG